MLWKRRCEMADRMSESEMKALLEVLAKSPPSAQLPLPTIHYTELPEMRPGQPLATESNSDRREAGRLLAEGNEGKWVWIKGEQVMGAWKTRDEALRNAIPGYPLPPVYVR